MLNPRDNADETIASLIEQGEHVVSKLQEDDDETR
jgi:hypothetical protein